MICIYWRRLKRLTAAWTTSHYFSNVAMDIYLFTTAQGDRLQRLDHSRCSLHEFVSRWIVDKQSFFFYLDASNHIFTSTKCLAIAVSDLTIKPSDGGWNIMHPELVREPPSHQSSPCIWWLTHILWLSLKSLVNRINKQVRIEKKKKKCDSMQVLTAFS